MKRIWSGFIAILLLLMMITVLVLKYRYNFEYQSISIHRSIVEKTFDHFGEEAVSAGAEYDLPPEYLLSLIVLESSGRKIIPQRFEPHIYRKLDQVARGRLDNLEGITARQLHGKTEAELKELSSSWGPFQIMGYKSIEIGVKVHDFQGKDAMKTGAKWIDLNYGDLLREGNYKDAFHIHNTGRPHPKKGPARTYRKDYVTEGLEYAEEFKELIAAM